jgi:hypothetical protein
MVVNIPIVPHENKSFHYHSQELDTRPYRVHTITLLLKFMFISSIYTLVFQLLFSIRVYEIQIILNLSMLAAVQFIIL